MPRWVVMASSFGDMADHHCTAETAEEAVAAFHDRYGDLVTGFDVKAVNIDEVTFMRDVFEARWEEGGGSYSPESAPYLGPY